MSNKPSIPKDEISFQFSRSSGPGGQNVNRVATKATLRWKIADSRALSNQQKQLAMQFAPLRSHINSEGEVVINRQSERSQRFNKEAALSALYKLLELALKPKKKRVRCKVPSGEKERRLKAKRLRSKRLQVRKRGSWED